jgi:Ni,Fe-hydrogenase III small subunit
MRKLLFKNALQMPVTEPAPPPSDDALRELAGKVDAAARRKLGRSLSIREVDAGSCNGCELEIHALNNAFYDHNMREALERTYRATPDPKWVVAVGDCAFDGGLFAGSYAVVGGVSAVVPVDLHIKGCPPSPMQLLTGLLALLQRSAGA